MAQTKTTTPAEAAKHQPGAKRKTIGRSSGVGSTHTISATDVEGNSTSAELDVLLARIPESKPVAVGNLLLGIESLVPSLVRALRGTVVRGHRKRPNQHRQVPQRFTGNCRLPV